jgi:hypothetical protein
MLLREAKSNGSFNFDVRTMIVSGKPTRYHGRTATRHAETCDL